MPQSFFLVRLSGIKGPMTFSKVLDSYYDGQIHDSTPVWDSGCRRWYQFAELKLPLVRKVQPEAVMRQLEVAWVAEGANPLGFAGRNTSHTIVSQGRIFRHSTSRCWPC
jgi:hypothetical protein